MALDTRPVRSAHGQDRAGAPRRTPTQREPGDDRGRPSRSLVVALVLACLTLMVVDRTGGADSPLAAVRDVVGDVIGPIEAATSTVVGPVAALPGALRTNDDLRDEVAALEDERAELRNRLDKAGYDERRVADLGALRRMAGDLGYALLPARVVAREPAQGFGATVTIDAGSDAGLHADMAVVAPEGLIGRITSVTTRTATVQLIIDTDSAVGGRIADNDELGFVRGHGALGVDDRLEMELADRNVVPRVGQPVVTWGSRDDAPYPAGVPIGRVAEVYESVRETSYRAVIEPNVDFTTLDLVSVVVPSGTAGRVIEADGSLR